MLAVRYKLTLNWFREKSTPRTNGRTDILILQTSQEETHTEEKGPSALVKTHACAQV